MRIRRLAYCVLPLLLACDAPAPTALLDPAAPAAAKGGNGGGGGNTDPALVGDVTGDAIFAPASELALSTCPGEVPSTYSILFRHTGCLIVTTTPAADGSTATLTDDVTLEVRSKKGMIREVRLTGQDVIGGDGIMHETDWIVLPQQVPADPAGFTVHLHVDGLEVWRLSGHLRGGRVAMVGTIALGDLVYRPAP